MEYYMVFLNESILFRHAGPYFRVLLKWEAWEQSGRQPRKEEDLTMFLSIKDICVSIIINAFLTYL